VRRLRYRIPVQGLPERFRGFRFTQVSDLHLSHVHTGVDRLAREVNREEPEAIFFTGDFVNRSHHLEPTLHLLSQLRPRLGAWAVLGNWERNWEIDVSFIRREFAARNVRLLVNEAMPLLAGDPGLYVAGVDDPHTGRANLGLTLDGIPRTATTLLLSHHPSVGPPAARRGVALTLAGHNHGGQFNIPGMPMFWMAPIELKYLAGLFDLGGRYMYVSRGLGTTGPRIRIRSPREITTFMLWPAD